MQIVKVSIKRESISFSYLEEKMSLSNFLNSNSLYKNELLYSFSYVNKNYNKVIDAVSEVCDKDETITFTFESFEIAFLFLPVLYKLKCDVNVDILENVSISLPICQKLLKIENLRSVKCYFMPENYVRKFGVKYISVYFRFNGVFSNKFVSDNELSDMKNIYYKRNIILSSDTLEDFKLFLTVNKHLGIIHIYEYDRKILRKLLDIIKNNCYLVIIHQTDENINVLSSGIKELKKLKREYRKKGGEVRIVYSDDYVRKNLFKQLTYSNLKICSVIIIYLAVVMLISNSYNDYVTWFNSVAIMNSISTDETMSTEILVPSLDNSPIQEDLPLEEDEEREDVNPYEGIPTEFEKLIKINKDTVGWISVNNTKINYPVVQSSDNDYYLNRDFYKRKTANGWVFMDFRNNAVDLNKNTIIYAHSLLSGYMFGDLDQTIKSSWYKNKENLVLTFNTLGSEMKWEVFSIYRTPYTTDYLKVNFYDDEAFVDFANVIKERSVYNFGVKIDKDDYIITLSTCVGNDNDRLVMHARLIQG